MIKHYVLDADGEAVEEPDLLRWALWFEHADRRLAYDDIGDMAISTVFVGFHRRWETMIFGGEFAGYQRCCETRVEALQVHQACVAEARLAADCPVILCSGWVVLGDSVTFVNWAADHLARPWHLFRRFGKLGFADAADAAVFKLSLWCDT